MHNASYFEKSEDGKVKCKLCPHECLIRESKAGICKVRKNMNGELYALTYEKVSGLNFDPIEKKPLYHFYPGSVIFSIGSFGCNLQCKFCQNWQTSQSTVFEDHLMEEYSPEELIEISLEKKGNIGIAYTYNEPTVWFECMIDIAKQAKLKGLKNVMVTNGFISKEPLTELLEYMDAFNVDLKAFTEKFYHEITYSRLEPVKENLKIIKQNKKHLEITNLVIPTLNDDEKTFEQMVKWIADELGEETILHLSGYYPTYKMSIDITPVSTLINLHNIAKRYLNYVYVGNVATVEGKDTYCSQCGKVVIRRTGYSTDIFGLDRGSCKFCNHKIINYY